MEKIISEINTRNNNTVFTYLELKNCEKFITDNNLTYKDHGSTALCYGDENYIYKICQKSTLNLQKFRNNYRQLIMKKINIVPMEIVYEDSTSFIYKQKKCKVVSLESINYRVCYDILNIIKSLYINNILYPDLFCKNFGYNDNKCYLFDYHDNNVFSDINNCFYIVGLYSLLYYCFTKNTVSNTILSYENIVEIDFGKDLFPEEFCKFLRNINQKDITATRNSIEECLEHLRTKLETIINDYQHFKIDYNNHIELYRHTLDKFKMTERLIPLYKKEDNIIRVLDAGCCFGGIGFKIAQTHSNVVVTLNNITESELKKMNELNSLLNLKNLDINSDNILEHFGTYDIGLYFSLVHHMLKNGDLKFVLNKIFSQCNIAIIEFPIQGDGLLKVNSNKLEEDKKSNYNVLVSLSILIENLEKHVKIYEIVRMNYNNDNIIRYSIICKKLI